jgi:hypothetical protein
MEEAARHLDFSHTGVPWRYVLRRCRDGACAMRAAGAPLAHGGG